MTIAKMFTKKLSKNHSRWMADHKKWKKEQMKVASALKGLEKLIKRHDDQIKTFERNVKSRKSLASNNHRSKAVLGKILKAHRKQNMHHALHTRARNDILRIAKTMENTLKHFSLN